MNPKHHDDRSFQYAPTIVLNQEKIISHPDYNRKEINYLSKVESTIAHNILYIKEKEICPAYISKINSNCEKQIILLKIPNAENKALHYLAAKKSQHS